MRELNRIELRVAKCSLIVCLVLFHATTQLAGQVNIEALRTEHTDSGFVGSMGADLTLRTGNVELIKLKANARLEHIGESATWLLLTQGDLGFVGGERFSNDGLLHIRHGMVVTSIVTLEGFAQVNYDRARLLKFRGIAGAGPRLYLVSDQGQGFSLGAAYMYEHEVLDLPATAIHPLKSEVHRASFYGVAKLSAGPRVVFASTTYFQPRLDEFEDMRVLNNTGMAIAVSGRISLVLRFNLRYDSRPPDGVAGLDTELTNGLSIRF